MILSSQREFHLRSLAMSFNSSQVSTIILSLSTIHSPCFYAWGTMSDLQSTIIFSCYVNFSTIKFLKFFAEKRHIWRKIWWNILLFVSTFYYTKFQVAILPHRKRIRVSKGLENWRKFGIFGNPMKNLTRFRKIRIENWLAKIFFLKTKGNLSNASCVMILWKYEGRRVKKSYASLSRLMIRANG